MALSMVILTGCGTININIPTDDYDTSKETRSDSDYEEFVPVKTFSLNGELMRNNDGVYIVKAVKGDKLDGNNPKTIGIPRVAKQKKEDLSTSRIRALSITLKDAMFRTTELLPKQLLRYQAMES